jgi:hypothetical protein
MSDMRDLYALRVDCAHHSRAHERVIDHTCAYYHLSMLLHQLRIQIGEFLVCRRFKPLSLWNKL